MSEFVSWMLFDDEFPLREYLQPKQLHQHSHDSHRQEVLGRRLGEC